jgi:uncharacterized protein YijF (DUF1287 family)
MVESADEDIRVNIGAGPVEDDILLAYPITGHYGLLAVHHRTPASVVPP